MILPVWRPVWGLPHRRAREVEQALRARFDAFLNEAALVSREEFEAVRDMAAAARAENDALRAELDALKAQLDKTAK